MSYTIDELINIRKEKWKQDKDLEFDNKLRSAIANEIYDHKELLDEIRLYPEKFIELEFVIVDKEQNVVPFFLNEVQKALCEIINDNKQKYKDGLITRLAFLILKGRQQGITSFLTAYQLSCSLLNPNFSGFTLADVAKNAEVIFQNKAKYPFSQLPEKLKPTEKFNNKKQFMFEVLNSSWEVDTATDNVGRSRTINFFHGSECAFWKNGMSSILAAIGEAFTKGCLEFYETTANGYNDYQKLWDSGSYINVFFEWWKTTEYRLDFPSEAEKESFLKKIELKNEWIWERLRLLKDSYKLIPEQLYWYFKKYEGYIDKDLIKQEYPCFPKEAFLMSGNPAFDSETIANRISSLSKPLKIGYFEYDYDETKPYGYQISNIRWVNDRNGFIKIYQLPDTPHITKYCIGGDTAGDGSDYYTGHVLDARTGNQAAVLKHQFDPDLYTKQMYCLGKYYNNALIGIETNFDTYPVIKLQELGYYNQYVREHTDYYTKKKEKKFGFKTTQITRPVILSRLVEIVRNHPELINDLDTLEELLSIIKNENNRIEAPEGGHDDQMMGLAIAHHIKDQVIFNEEPIISNPTFRFNTERSNAESYDYGEEMTIV